MPFIFFFHNYGVWVNNIIGDIREIGLLFLYFVGLPPSLFSLLAWLFVSSLLLALPTVQLRVPLLLPVSKNPMVAGGFKQLPC